MSSAKRKLQSGRPPMDTDDSGMQLLLRHLQSSRSPIFLVRILKRVRDRAKQFGVEMLRTPPHNMNRY